MLGRKLEFWEIAALEKEEKLKSSRITTNEKLISLEQLFERWPGANTNEILQLESIGELLPFFREKTLLEPQTLNCVHWLQPTSIYNQNCFSDISEPEYSPCVFIEKNILKLEEQHPEFLWQRLNDEEFENVENQNPDLLPLNNLYIEKDSVIAALKKEIISLKAENEELRGDGREAPACDCQGFFERYPICGLIRDLDRRGLDRDHIRMELQNRTDYPVKAISFLTSDSASYQTGGALKKSFQRSKGKTTGGK